MKILPMFRRRSADMLSVGGVEQGQNGHVRSLPENAGLWAVHRASAIEIDLHRRGHPAVDAEWTLF